MKKFFLNKRGSIEEMLEHIPYIILTMIVLGGITALLSYASNPKIDSSAVQAEVFANRILYSKDSISIEKAGSPRVGIIDENFFNSNRLNNVTVYDYERQISAKLDVYLVDQSFGKDPFKTAYYNQVWYERLEPLASSEISGAGSARIFTKKIPVVYRQGNADLNAVLKMQIVIPN